ncbi:hypothetical protein [Nonomuraea recticatena]|uniref:hypothetical protein n=1 Tax=Nonomuraea recticatena TaxID=46178 RepID=UPI0031F76D3F
MATDVVVEVTDHLGSLSRPPPHARSGYGLWFMGQLCDELVVAQGAGRFSVRLRMRSDANDDGAPPRITTVSERGRSLLGGEGVGECVMHWRRSTDGTPRRRCAAAGPHRSAARRRLPPC